MVTDVVIYENNGASFLMTYCVQLGQFLWSAGVAGVVNSKLQIKLGSRMVEFFVSPWNILDQHEKFRDKTSVKQKNRVKISTWNLSLNTQFKLNKFLIRHGQFSTKKPKPVKVTPKISWAPFFKRWFLSEQAPSREVGQKLNKSHSYRLGFVFEFYLYP